MQTLIDGNAAISPEGTLFFSRAQAVKANAHIHRLPLVISVAFELRRSMPAHRASSFAIRNFVFQLGYTVAYRAGTRRCERCARRRNRAGPSSLYCVETLLDGWHVEFGWVFFGTANGAKCFESRMGAGSAPYEPGTRAVDGEHRALDDAALNRDPEKAADVLQDHLLETNPNLLRDDPEIGRCYNSRTWHRYTRAVRTLRACPRSSAASQP